MIISMLGSAIGYNSRNVMEVMQNAETVNPVQKLCCALVVDRTSTRCSRNLAANS